MNVYLAGPLFTVAERQFNVELAQAISIQYEHIRFILPQEHAQLIAGTPSFSRDMFEHAIRSVSVCDAMLAILDGADADSGTCVEIGYAGALHKPIVGLRTDLRPSEDNGVNLMISNMCRGFLWMPSTDITTSAIAAKVGSELQRVTA